MPTQDPAEHRKRLVAKRQAPVEVQAMESEPEDDPEVPKAVDDDFDSDGGLG